MDTDEASWEKKKKGGTRRKEEKLKICELSQDSTVGERLETMAVQFLCLSEPVKN